MPTPISQLIWWVSFDEPLDNPEVLKTIQDLCEMRNETIKIKMVRKDGSFEDYYFEVNPGDTERQILASHKEASKAEVRRFLDNDRRKNPDRRHEERRGKDRRQHNEQP